MSHPFIELTPDDLRNLLDNLKEKNYLLIDVRQPHEYALGHIPGAHLMPLLEFESKLFDLPDDRELIIYCQAGPRSRMAALLVQEAELTGKPVYHLTGGMMAWDGVSVSDFPKIQLLGDGSGDPMTRAMNLEKGAYRFYRELAARYPDEPFAPVIRQLETAEKSHARIVYGFWRQSAADSHGFESYFEGLSGDVLEGGVPLAEAVSRIQAVTARKCLTILEFALDIEYQAYDLYRSMAETALGSDAREAFYAIAQAEKAHMKQLARAVDGCDR